MTEPALVFLPWVRRGGSLSLPPDDRASHPPNHVGTTVGVSVNGVPGADVPVQLLGPGEVTSLAPQQVIRTDPAPGAQSFESNYLALIEFDDPGLPWLFTPASADAGRLRPWLCLVVVREQPGVSVEPAGRGPLPVLRIGTPARPELELPDLADSWAWAHAQVAADDPGAAVVQAALGGDPARTLSRLVSGRLLAEQTPYLACVVPTFEAGRRRGLGLEPGDATGAAWRLADGMGTVELPVYHWWRFATGPAGDFQSLALAIRGRTVEPGFGSRPVDLSTSGLSLPGMADLQAPLAGALLAAEAPLSAWPQSADARRIAGALRDLLNAPDEAPAAEPLLAPPRYGAAYRPVPALAATGGGWYEQLNTDPVARIAAGLGTRVVQSQQETLVAAAWDQSVDLQPATRLVGLAALGFAIAGSLHRRHVAPLLPQSGLFVLAPLQPRLLAAAPSRSGADAFGVQWSRASVPSAVLGSAVRRVLRSRGPAVRTVTRSTPLPERPNWLASMLPRARIERSFTPRIGPVTVDDLGPLLPAPREVTWAQLSAQAVRTRPPRPGFTLTATPDPGVGPRPLPLPGDVRPRGLDLPLAPDLEATPARPPGRPGRPVRPFDVDIDVEGGGGIESRARRRRPGDPGEPDPVDPDPIDPDPTDPVDPRPPRQDSPAAALFRDVAARHLEAFLAAPPQRPTFATLSVDALFDEAVALTRPDRTFSAAVATLLTAPEEPAAPEVPLPALRFVPSFATPMASALAELGQHWLLPGLDGVPANTALALRTNGPFVEAFLAGLNSEFGRELLWREFPTPLDATFFDRFWDAAVAPDEPPDIPPMAEWADRALGAPTLRKERFVLLLRSELIRRFPDAVVTAVRRGIDTPITLAPVFRGSLDPDVSYFGFAIDLDEADSYAVRIAEQLGAPRFGFDVGEAPSAIHAPVNDADPARLAARLRQWPARITIPIAVLMREPTP